LLRRYDKERRDMGRMSGHGSGLFKQDHPRAIDRHIDYFGDGVDHLQVEPHFGVEPHRAVEPRQSRPASWLVRARESVVVIVAPFARRRRPPALAGAR
jgi:hypothetical protein